MPWNPRQKKSRSGWTTNRDDYTRGWRVHIDTFQPGDVLQSAGRTAYADGNAGWWIGVDPSDGIAKLDFGNATKYMRWTGSELEFSGSITWPSPPILDQTRALKWTNGTDIWAQLYNYNYNDINYIILDAAADTAHNFISIEAGSHEHYPATIHLSAETDGGGVVELHLETSATLERARLAAAYLDLTNTNATLKIGGVQVIGPRHPGLEHCTVTAGSAEDGAARTTINEILTALETHGLLDTL